MSIKHSVGGVALLAGVAIAVSAWAQGPAPTGRSYGGFSGSSANPGPGPMATTPAWEHPTPPSAPPSAAANSPAPPAHHAVRHTRAMHAFQKKMAGKAVLIGNTTSQLNREELARIQSGGPPR